MDQAVVGALFERSAQIDVDGHTFHECEAGTLWCVGHATKIHHRLLRKHGGGDELDNLLHVCNPCHLYIHANPEISYDQGWLIRSHGHVR